MKMVLAVLRLLLKIGILAAAMVLLAVLVRVLLPVIVPLALVLGLLVMLRWAWRIMGPRRLRQWEQPAR